MINREFTWINESRMTVEGSKYTVYAPALTDFFFNNEAQSSGGVTPLSLCNAPFYYTEISGDFVLKVQVSLDFVSTYDSASLMVMSDMRNWAKSCFELTDFGTHAVVSVVARDGETDDANGVTIDEDRIWLRVTRKGNVFAFHYSVDGQQFYMSRVFSMAADERLKVGFLAQAPTGDGGERHYEHLSIEQVTVSNIRSGE